VSAKPQLSQNLLPSGRLTLQVGHLIVRYSGNTQTAYSADIIFGRRWSSPTVKAS
jgi:hypothetical protein